MLMRNSPSAQGPPPWAPSPVHVILCAHIAGTAVSQRNSYAKALVDVAAVSPQNGHGGGDVLWEQRY